MLRRDRVWQARGGAELRPRRFARACAHLVYKADEPRLSISYEVRLAWRVDGAAWLRGAARKRKRTAEAAPRS